MVDPVTIRLSDSLLLSDFCGTHSCYTKGIANPFEDPTGEKAQEGVCLAETVIEPVLATSPISISYGYTSDTLAPVTHGYRDASAPSYHKWTNGAACDIVVHDMDAEGTAPIYIAQALDDEFPLSRLITYSESPFICVATRYREVHNGVPRRAFYENRYAGRHKAKPEFYTIQNRDQHFSRLKLPVDWRGQGYPSYHGRGVRQVHHIRTSKYTVLSDFLYSSVALAKGYKNCPTLTDQWIGKFRRAGRLYDALLEGAKTHRLSIVRAYESPVWNKTTRYRWENEFEIDFIPPENVNQNDVAQVASKLASSHGVLAVSVNNGDRRVSIRGTLEGAGR